LPIEQGFGVLKRYYFEDAHLNSAKAQPFFRIFAVEKTSNHQPEKP
jgi:hypothetical protein